MSIATTHITRLGARPNTPREREKMEKARAPGKRLKISRVMTWRFSIVIIIP
jgi:hypothetical protein